MMITMNNFSSGDLVIVKFAADREVGIIISMTGKNTFNILVDGNMCRATKSMLEKIKDEQVQV